jgi:hypothetical protein
MKKQRHDRTGQTCEKCGRDAVRIVDGASLCTLHANARARPPCTVCQEDVIRGHALGCGHVFHAKCIRTWVESSSKCVNCPVCRAPLAQRDLDVLKPKLVDPETERKREERDGPQGYVELPGGEIVEIRSQIRTQILTFDQMLSDYINAWVQRHSVNRSVDI